jgi:NADH-quinone oxidoreductase subunit M
MPIYSAIFFLITLSSVGFPTTNGFIGEFLILLGVFEVNKTAAVLAATGVVLGAIYMLWMYQRVFFGRVSNPKNEKLKDLNFREMAYLLLLVALVFWIGLFPNFFLSKMHSSVDHFISQVKISEPASPGAVVEHHAFVYDKTPLDVSSAKE